MRPGLAAVLLLLVAGCVDPLAANVAPATADAQAVREALAVAVAGLPCDAEVGAGTSANVDVLATLSLDEGSHGELAVFGDLGALARYQTGGFDLVDLADPLAPRALATWDPEETDRALDVKFTPDGATLVVGGDKAIHLLDVRDPLAPRVESVYPLTKPQAHMLSVFEVGGATWVAAPKGEGYDLAIYRVVGEPGARALEPASQPPITLLGERTGQDLLRSHDAWFTVDESLGKPLLWVANSWDGIVALDVSDPAAPTIAARLPNADPYQGYTHTVQTTFVDGRRLVVAVQEVGANALKVYDASDLAAPKLVGVWHVPVVAKPQHNLQLVAAHAFVAHYDEGVYAFDLAGLAGPVPARLEPVAHLTGTANGGTGPGASFAGTWDVVVHRGLLFTSEIADGVRVAAFGCLAAGDPTVASTG